MSTAFQDCIRASITGRPELARAENKHNSSLVEEEVDTQTCACSKAADSGSHTVAKCELYKEAWDALEVGMRDPDECSV